MSRPTPAVTMRKSGRKRTASAKRPSPAARIEQAITTSRAPKRDRTTTSASTETHPAAPASRRARTRPKRFDDPDFEFGDSGKAANSVESTEDEASASPSRQHSTGQLSTSNYDGESASDSESSGNSASAADSGGRRSGISGARSSGVSSFETVRLRRSTGFRKPGRALTQAASAQHVAVQRRQPLTGLPPSTPASIAAALTSAASSAAVTLMPGPCQMSVPGAPQNGERQNIRPADQLQLPPQRHLQRSQRLRTSQLPQHQQQEESGRDPLELFLSQEVMPGNVDAGWLDAFGASTHPTSPLVPTIEGALRGAASRAHQSMQPHQQTQPQQQYSRQYWYNGAWHPQPPSATVAAADLGVPLAPLGPAALQAQPVFLPVSNGVAAGDLVPFSATVAAQSAVGQSQPATDASSAVGGATELTADTGDATYITAAGAASAEDVHQQPFTPEHLQPTCQPEDGCSFDVGSLDDFLCASPRSVLPAASAFEQEADRNNEAQAIMTSIVDDDESILIGNAPSFFDWLSAMS